MMTLSPKVLLAFAAVLTLAGCATAPPRANYSALRAENPRSILVVPPTNKSVEVNAPDYFLTTIDLPLTERGYYVFPINTVRAVMADDGLSDANMVHAGDPRRLGELFGADAVMYISIERWDARYIVLSTTVTVDLTYVLKSTKTGQDLWRNHRTVVYEPAGHGGGIAGLIADAVQAAITKAAPNYLPLAILANEQAVGLKGTGLPAGVYNTAYQKDSADF
jgi:hypothetical protein